MQRSGVACLSVRSCGTNAPAPRGSAGREGCRSLPSHPRQYRRSPVYTLQELGWCDFVAQQVGDESDFLPARVAGENREFYRILCEPGEFLAELSGKLRHATTSRADLPAVGDWVLAQLRPRENRAMIHRVLERKAKFSRKTAGRRTEEQI